MAKKLFISYSHADAEQLERLHKHLAQLERDGTVSGWYDREIHAGGDLDKEIGSALEGADVFIACASPDYIASNYCYDKELDHALEREAAGKLTIVPVIFEPCDWLNTPLSKFKALPKDGKPISEYTNPNIGFLEVITALRSLATQTSEVAIITPDTPQRADQIPTPSRYRVKREFDQLDKRDFVERSFNEMYRFFEASVGEIESLPDIQARLSPLAEDTFSCTVINRGIKRGFETVHVRRGGSWGAIDYLFGEQNSRSTSNGGFSVETDDYQQHLRSSSFGFGSTVRENLTSSEAAQLLWDELLKRVGIDYA